MNTVTHKTLRTLTGRVIERAGFLEPLTYWAWVVETIAREFACEPDAVSCIERDDGDYIGVSGVPVAYLEYA